MVGQEASSVDASLLPSFLDMTMMMTVISINYSSGRGNSEYTRSSSCRQRINVRLDALMALETVGVPGSCTGTSFTGRPLLMLNDIYIAQQQVKNVSVD